METKKTAVKAEEQKEETKDVFDVLVHINVNDHVETKNTGKTTLTYLSWPWAWQEVRSRYPDVSYEIMRNAEGFPYFYDPALGIMVYTTVTIRGETSMMWLPVMDGANNAMKFEAYEIPTRFGPKQVAAATMFDINKTIMRCLVKNLAMFGLGLYIYAGEDMPNESEDEKIAKIEEERKKQAELKDIIVSIDKETARLTKGMKTEEKASFGEKYIIPIVGKMNYKTCDNPAKLRTLLENLEKLEAA